jgi:transcriptional regulator with XRE-family HTH domain
MAARRQRPLRTAGETKLARLRLERDVRREELAAAVGVSTSTLGRLERGEIEDPSLRVLANCALALGVALEDVIEDEWRRWWDPYGGLPAPRSARGFWPPAEADE